MKRTAISHVFAWEALDSRGKPTVGCEVTLSGGTNGVALVPSGASTGTYEAVELRDGESRFGGLGVLNAVRNVVETIGPAIKGMDASDGIALDLALTELDGTDELSRLGANAVLSVSIASRLSAASAEGVPLYRYLSPHGRPLLPMPMINIISGGAHAAGAVDLQDFLAVPVGAQSFTEAIEWCWLVRRGAVEAALRRGLSANLVADEGGLGPPLTANREPIELLLEAIERSQLSAGEDVAIAIDVAANQLLSERGYLLAKEGRTLDAAAWIGELEEWATEFPIVSIEDPLGEDDWDSWRKATETMPQVQLLGDDLFVTNAERLQRGIDEGVGNAVLVKPNQAGTLSRAERVIEIAKSAGFATVVSARSGETEDSWLSDLAVGWKAGQIKVGSLARSERTAKWNRLLRIEQEDPDTEFAGRGMLGGSR